MSHYEQKKEATMSRIERLKTIDKDGVVKMAEALEITGYKLYYKHDLASVQKAWETILMCRTERSDHASTLFDSAMRFVEKRHWNGQVLPEVPESRKSLKRKGVSDTHEKIHTSKEGVSYVQVYAMPMSELIGKKKNEKCHGGVFGMVDPYDLYKKLYDVWDTMPSPGSCLEEEEKILRVHGFDMPLSFESGKHPLKECTVPADYGCAVGTFLNNLKMHIDHDEEYGNFDDDGGTLIFNKAYVLKNEKDRKGWVSIWPKEIYAAVHAAREGQDYAEYLTWPIDKFLKIGVDQFTM
tara:strand:+ start:1666 stop:2550 length:885 start_codon:yes stop_codon:yes gene_type:complete